MKKNINMDDIWNKYDSLKNELKEVEAEVVVKKRKSDDEKCKNCGEYSLINNEGSIVCSNCGLFSSMVVVSSQEWRSYNDSSPDSDRCGMPVNPLLPKSSFGTMVLGTGYEFIRKLDKWNNVVYKEKSLLNVFGIIGKDSKKGGLPQCVIDKANLLYKILSEDIIKRGSSRKAFIASCVYYSCLEYSYKNKNFIKSHEEISKLFGVSRKKMTKGCKQFSEIMFHKENNYLNKIKPKTYEYYVKGFCRKLDITIENCINMVLKIANNSNKLGIVCENTPRSIAVGSIYLFIIENDISINKKKIATVCEISEVTILKTYKKLVPWKKFLI